MTWPRCQVGIILSFGAVNDADVSKAYTIRARTLEQRMRLPDGIRGGWEGDVEGYNVHRWALSRLPYFVHTTGVVSHVSSRVLHLLRSALLLTLCVPLPIRRRQGASRHAA